LEKDFLENRAGGRRIILRWVLGGEAVKIEGRGVGSGSTPTAVFDVSGAEPSGSKLLK
jgi:hypothetical protein